MKFPDLNKILAPNKEIYKPGYGLKSASGKLDILEQGTTPKDKDLLKKLGIKKGERVLSIATFYASWAKSLRDSGARVDYSDVSKPLTNWAKKNFKNTFENYYNSNYELIPKEANKYDWIFTYEACGAGRGLPIAYLRSLLNKKGGILVIHLGSKEHQIANAPKIQKYPNIVNILSKIYGADSKVIKKKIRSFQRGEKQIKNYEFLISRIKTNSKARQNAQIDLEVLNYLKSKRKINLKVDSKKLKINTKELKSSLIRLNKLAKIISDKYQKEVEIK